MQYVKSWYTSQWYTTSGWYLLAHNHTLYPTDPDFLEVVGRGYSKMSNFVFGCPTYTGPTYTEYINEIRMFWDGLVTFPWNANTWGDCAGLLSSNRFSAVY